MPALMVPTMLPVMAITPAVRLAHLRHTQQHHTGKQRAKKIGETCLRVHDWQHARFYLNRI
jgi:hypothetical protein